MLRYCLMAAVAAGLTFGDITGSAFAQKSPFVSDTLDLGKMNQGSPKSGEFKFTGGEGITEVKKIQSTCGCVVISDYTKLPIKRRDSGSITVTHNGMALGAFAKTVTVTFSNLPQPFVITVKGTVIAAPAKK
jgi:hypothetical protein